MRRRLAIPLIAAVGAAPWLWFYPDPAPDGLPAQLSAIVDVPDAGDWLGGLSGLDLTADGQTFHAVTDRGQRATGRLIRDDGRLVSLEITDHQPLTDRFGEVRKFPFTDAEGVALDESGKVFVSFEHAHRVLLYDRWDAAARWPSYTRAWRALSNNKGLEALAVAPDGTLYAIPEEINLGAWEALVYRKRRGEGWTQAFTLPVDSEFAPVGADFGPDGRFYVLERGFFPFGFFSRVRSMTVSDQGFADIVTVLHTGLFDHGNLEGLAVWRDEVQDIRLTMVSDDNFYPFMRGQIVEYVLPHGLAKDTE
ncbi:MAG: esterase-like activity of phytase family protein [Pseudomonadota bacterium]